MKKHLSLALLLSGIFLVVGCAHQSDEAPLQSSNRPVCKKTASFSYGDYELAHLIGEWHNESMYAFIDYLRDNDLNPYTACGLSDEMIHDFMSEYMRYRFEENQHLMDEWFMNEPIEFDIDQMWQINQELFSLVQHSDNYESLDSDIRYYMDVLISDSPSPQMELLYAIIGNVALKSNVLWSSEWDWRAQTLIPDELAYCLDYAEGEGGEGNEGAEDDDNNGEGTSGEGEDSEGTKNPNQEKQDAIIQADIAGAIGGAIKGAVEGALGGSTTGPVVVLVAAGGAIIEASIDGAAASIAAAIVAEMNDMAKYIYEEDVTIIENNSYMWQYLRNVYVENPSRFYDLYGNKFDQIIND